MPCPFLSVTSSSLTRCTLRYSHTNILSPHPQNVTLHNSLPLYIPFFLLSMSFTHQLPGNLPYPSMKPSYISPVSAVSASVLLRASSSCLYGGVFHTLPPAWPCLSSKLDSESFEDMLDSCVNRAWLITSSYYMFLEGKEPAFRALVLNRLRGTGRRAILSSRKRFYLSHNWRYTTGI